MAFDLKILSEHYNSFVTAVKNLLDSTPILLAEDDSLQLEYLLLKTKYLGFIQQWHEWLNVDQAVYQPPVITSPAPSSQFIKPTKQEVEEESSTSQSSEHYSITHFNESALHQDHLQNTQTLLEILDSVEEHVDRFSKTLEKESNKYQIEVLQANLKNFAKAKKNIIDIINQPNDSDTNKILQKYRQALEWTFKQYLNFIIGGILINPENFDDWNFRHHAETLFERSGIYLPREITNPLEPKKLFGICKMAFFEVKHDGKLISKFDVSCQTQGKSLEERVKKMSEDRLDESDMILLKKSMRSAVDKEMTSDKNNLPSFKVR